MPRHASQLVPLPAKEPRRSYHHARRRAPILLAMLIPIAPLDAAVQGAEQGPHADLSLRGSPGHGSSLLVRLWLCGDGRVGDAGPGGACGSGTPVRFWTGSGVPCAVTPRAARAGRRRSGRCRTPRSGKTWTTAARRLISRPECSIGLPDQILGRCYLGRAAKAVRPGSAWVGMSTTSGREERRGPATCSYRAVTAFLKV